MYPQNGDNVRVVYGAGKILLYLNNVLATTLVWNYSSMTKISGAMELALAQGYNSKTIAISFSKFVSKSSDFVENNYGQSKTKGISQAFFSKEVQKARNLKLFHFSLDDFIAAFKDITDNVSTYTSIFDNATFAWLKQLHDNYGCCVSCYCFYETSDASFNLSQCTNAFASEFTANASWLKFGFHGLNINSIYTSASSSTAATHYDNVITQLLRITGSVECIDRCPRISSYTGGVDAMKAFRDTDCGIVGALTAMNTDASTPRDSYYFTSDQNAYMNKHCKYYDADMQLTFFKTSYNVFYGTSDYINSKSYANLRNFLILFLHENDLSSGNKSAVQSACSTYVNNGFVSDFPMNHCLNH